MCESGGHVVLNKCLNLNGCMSVWSRGISFCEWSFRVSYAKDSSSTCVERYVGTHILTAKKTTRRCFSTCVSEDITSWWWWNAVWAWMYTVLGEYALIGWLRLAEHCADRVVWLVVPITYLLCMWFYLNYELQPRKCRTKTKSGSAALSTSTKLNTHTKNIVCVCLNVRWQPREVQSFVSCGRRCNMRKVCEYVF